jgi:hypothetical protein
MTTVVCFTMNQLGEPDAGKPHVRFDERGVETELRQLRHASTLLNVARAIAMKRGQQLWYKIERVDMWLR